MQEEKKSSSVLSESVTDEVNIREYVDIIWKNRGFILKITGAITLGTLVISLFLPKVYEARTSILVRQSSGGGLSSSLANLGALAGVSLPSQGGNIKDDLIDLLNSDLLADTVIDRVGLKNQWTNIRNTEGLRRRLKGMAKIPARPKTNLIEIKVQSADPTLAADVANAYVAALGESNAKLGYTEASKKRKFIEEQLPKVKTELKTAEDRLKFFTALLPRGGGGFQSAGFAGASSASQIPSSVEIARIAREVEVQNAVYTILRKELESTKLEEAKELEPFQVVDRAEVPMRKVKPKVLNNTLMALFLSVMGGIFLAFLKEYWKKTQQKPFSLPA